MEQQTLTLEIHAADGTLRARDTAEYAVQLVYAEEYRKGDTITLSAAKTPCFLVIQFDSCLNPAFVYMKEPSYTFEIPFDEKRFSYNPLTFAGDLHLVTARAAREEEIAVYKNLALNDHDTHTNTACFPHAQANIETPYESWGINRDPTACFTLDFGRTVCVDKIVLVCRADFPHDNYWKQIDVGFSDGSVQTILLEKSSLPHVFKLLPKKTESITLSNLIKDENLESPFPALTQIEVYGMEEENLPLIRKK